jgi:hypothetical protein
VPPVFFFKAISDFGSTIPQRRISMTIDTPDGSGYENLPPVPNSDAGDGYVAPPIPPAAATPAPPALGPIGSGETKPTLTPLV